MGVNFMKGVPNAMQGVANNERNRQPETKNAEHGEQNYRCGFQSPRSLISEIGGERQIKSCYRNEKLEQKRSAVLLPKIVSAK